MHAFDQHRYQVRFEWGTDGLTRLTASDVVIVVDVLRFSTTVTDAAARGERVVLADSFATSVNGAPVAHAAAESGAVVMIGGLRNATAVARAALDEQQRRGVRTSIAVIAAGERDPDGLLRFSVEDQLGAGAVIDALGALGIDHTSPEAATAAESFRGLRAAARHLLTASGSGQELIDRGERELVLAAAAVDAASVAPVLRDGVFVLG